MNLENLPHHLRKYTLSQNPQKYTAEDHAVWRFLLRQLKFFLKEAAHESYVEGLKKTGITIESIPNIEGIHSRLNQFGWGALPVSGFIPPAAFMEFQALSFLPIASDMRTIDHLTYTPAPDIVHEAAGHAPMLSHPEFAAYLKKYSQVARKAIISQEDLLQYQLIRELSDLKEIPSTPKSVIENIENKLAEVSRNMKTSEAGVLGRMNWWTAEYGLIGDIDDPKIFGAGLLSSLGEARDCLKPYVKKIPLSIDCINYAYDITEPQPQLFVAKDFQHLEDVLEELAQQMSFRQGGRIGLDRAIDAKTVNTVEFENGLQVSGKLVGYEVLHSEQKSASRKNPDEISFIKLEGPTQICFQSIELEGHSNKYHCHGFSSPLGRLKQTGSILSECFDSLDITPNQSVTLEFESGFVLTGIFESRLDIQGRPAILTFTQCRVVKGDVIYFEPEWGRFDLLCVSQVVSVYGGAADKESFGNSDQDFIAARVPDKKYSEEEKRHHNFYERLRDLRKNSHGEKGAVEDQFNSELFHNYVKEYKSQYSQQPKMWLAGLELLELSQFYSQGDFSQELEKDLVVLAKNYPSLAQCIQDGIHLSHFEDI